MLKSLICPLLLGCCLSLQAQSIVVQLSPEIGYALNSFPKHHTLKSSFPQEESILPKFNPMFGINWETTFWGHLQLDASLQYQFTGDIYTLSFLSNTTGDKSSKRTSTRYQTVCLPISLGYSFRVGKLRPFIGIGYRACYLTGSKVKDQYSRFDASTGTTTLTGSRIFHPLSDPSYRPYRPRYSPQVLASIGTWVGANLKVSFHGAVGDIGLPTRREPFEDRYYFNTQVYATAAWRIWYASTKSKPVPVFY